MIASITYRMVLALAILLTSLYAGAQQVGRYSMYMQNFYAMNPAAAGLENHLDATLAYRQQWIGFEHAPQMYFASANMPIKREYRTAATSSMRISNPDAYEATLPSNRKSRSGAGIMVNVNQYGAFRYSQFYGTYSYHLPVNSKINIAMGMNLGINSFIIDRNLITLEIPEDPFYDQALVDAQQNSNLLDIDVGFMVYSKRFFIGYSSEQLLGNTLALSGRPQFGDLLVHHRLLFGRNIRLDRDWKLIPNGFVYFTGQSLLSIETNVRVDYRDQIWGGVSYRHGDAIVPMIGMYIDDKVKIGYAFDINISKIRQYVASGSHEIMLGIMIGNKRLVF